jgi:hypothetical protein
VSAGATIAPDAAMVLGIASTAMPFARTPQAEAERWLRVLRLHGEAGAALQALGVSEGPLLESDEEVHDDRRALDAPAEDFDPVGRVSEHAAGIAGRRGAGAVATSDVLLAVMDVYGTAFDSVLQTHGTDRNEVLERLRASPPETPRDR